jgi:hypothetical protein
LGQDLTHIGPTCWLLVASAGWQRAAEERRKKGSDVGGHVHFSRGDEGKKMKATYIWQMATKWGRYVPFFLFCAFLNKGSSKTPLKKLGEIHVKNFWPKKLIKKAFFLSSFPIDFILSRFWPFLCMRSPKTP